MTDLEALNQEATPGLWGQFSPSYGPWQDEANEAFDRKEYGKIDTSHHMSAGFRPTHGEPGPVGAGPLEIKRIAEWQHASDAAFAEALVNAYRSGKLVEATHDT